MSSLRFFLTLMVLLGSSNVLPAKVSIKYDEKTKDQIIDGINRKIHHLKNISDPVVRFEEAYTTMKLSIESSYTPGKAESYYEIGTYLSDNRKHLPAIWFLLSSERLFAVLKDTAGILKVNQSIFTLEFYLKDYANALNYCQQSLEIARKRKDPANTGKFLSFMANVFQEQRDTTRSLDYYRESIKYYSKINDIKSSLGVIMAVSGIYLDQRRYDDVLKMYDTLSVFADSVSPEAAGIMYTRIAHLYDVKKNYRKALFKNKKALEIRQKSNFPDAVNSSLINIAGDFFKMNRTDSGFYYMDKGIQLALKYKRNFYLRNAYNVLYDYHLNKGNDEKALEYFKLLVAISDSLMNERLVSDINIVKTGQNIYMMNETNKILKSQNELQKSLIYNQNIFKFLLLIIILAVIITSSILMRTYLRLRNSKRSLENLNVKLQHEVAERKLIQKKTIEKDEQYKFIADHSLDLITKIDSQNNITFASPASMEILGISGDELSKKSLFDMILTGYSDHVKEKLSEIITSRQPGSVSFQARRKGSRPVWLESRLNPVFDTKTGAFREFVMVSRNIQELKKREMGVIEGTKQKENLLREIHHRVKNNFAILVSLINMQKAQSQDPALIQSFTDLQLRIRTMALVHEMLYRSEDFEKISFPDYIRSVASVISSTYGRMNIDLELDLEAMIINIETAIPLGLILNELLSNAYRHAFPGNMKGKISLELKKAREKGFYTMKLTDSGVGLPDGVNLEGKKSMGLQIVDILVKQIEARFEITNKNGTSFMIRFPLEH